VHRTRPCRLPSRAFVQAYFTWRAWVVSGKAWYARPPWLVEFVRLVIVIVNCGYLAGDKTLSDFRSDHGYLVTTTLITCLFVSVASPCLRLFANLYFQVDVWNSAVLVYHLGVQRITLRRSDEIPRIAEAVRSFFGQIHSPAQQHYHVVCRYVCGR
jgi:hypothetical protein